MSLRTATGGVLGFATKMHWLGFSSAHAEREASLQTSRAI